MCFLCDGGTVEELLDIERERIDHHGFTMVAVGGGIRSWTYTIGLLASFGHPELVITGGSAEAASAVITHLVDRIRSGECFDELSPDTSFEGVPIRFGSVHRTQWTHGRFAGWEEYYQRFGDTPLLQKAVQVLWPNEDDVFPPDPDFCHIHRECQPLLSMPVGHDVHEIARRKRRPKKRR